MTSSFSVKWNCLTIKYCPTIVYQIIYTIFYWIIWLNIVLYYFMWYNNILFHMYNILMFYMIHNCIMTQYDIISWNMIHLSFITFITITPIKQVVKVGPVFLSIFDIRDQALYQKLALCFKSKVAWTMNVCLDSLFFQHPNLL